MAAAIIATIIEALNAATALAPAITDLVPIVEKGFAVASGTATFTEEDVTALQSAADTIDAAVAAKVAEVEDAGAATS